MQELFVAHFVNTLNATLAAKEAGYSADSASELGYQLLQNPSVRQAVQEKLKTRFERLDMTGERILLEMFRIATVDISQAYDNLGQLIPLNEMPEDVRRAIVGLEVEEQFIGDGDARTLFGFTKKVKFADKNKALEMMGKYFKLLTDKVEHTGKDGAPLMGQLTDEQLDAKIAEAMARKGKT